MSRVRCPKCKNKVLQKSDEGATRVRIEGPIVFNNGACFAKCYFCKSTVQLPMDLQKGAGESFVIREPYPAPT